MAELAKADLDSTPSLQQWACKHQQRPVCWGNVHMLRGVIAGLVPGQTHASSALLSLPPSPKFLGLFLLWVHWRLCDTAELWRTKRCTVLFPGERLQLFTYKTLSHPNQAYTYSVSISLPIQLQDPPTLSFNQTTTSTISSTHSKACGACIMHDWPPVSHLSFSVVVYLVGMLTLRGTE